MSTAVPQDQPQAALQQDDVSTAVPQVQPQAALDLVNTFTTALEGDRPQAVESQPQAATSQPQAAEAVPQETGKVHTPRGITVATPAVGGNLGYLNPIVGNAAQQVRRLIQGMSDADLLHWAASQAATQRQAPATQAADQGLPQAAVRVAAHVLEEPALVPGEPAHVPEEPADVPEEQEPADVPEEPADVPGPAMPFLVTPGPEHGRSCQSDMCGIYDDADFASIRVP